MDSDSDRMEQLSEGLLDPRRKTSSVKDSSSGSSGDKPRSFRAEPDKPIGIKQIMFDALA